MTKSEQNMYDKDLKRKWDNDLAAASSRDRGKAEGRIEGRIEGEIEKSRLLLSSTNTNGFKAGFDVSIYNPSANQFFDRYRNIDHIVVWVYKSFDIVAGF